jgi:hypothetical protein
MRTLLVTLAALVAVVGGGRALADAPCLADAERLCPGIPAGDRRLWACLLRNEFKLSSSCVRNVREVQRRASEFNSDCASDIWRFCPQVPKGGGRILDCLGAYVGRRELSSNCEGAVVTAIENLHEFNEGCAEDAAAFCAGVQPGGGRVFLCLRAQSDRLSSRCKRAMSP